MNHHFSGRSKAMLPSLRAAASAELLTTLCCLALFILLAVFPTQVRAADTFFTSGTLFKEELNRLGGEGKLFVTAPLDTYLPQTVAVAGAFALSYLYDEDIRKDLAANRSRTLTHATDAGSIVGDPYLQIGVAAVLYGAGALSDKPKLQELGEKLGEAMVLADVGTLVLKQAVGRARPAAGNGAYDFRPFQFKNDYDSLPSMHTASSFAVAHVLANETESLPVKILCYTGAGFVGFSRLYQAKHWASDVVLAAAIGELAGNSVTRYRSLKPGGVTIVPTVSGGVPTLALMGKF